MRQSSEYLHMQEEGVTQIYMLAYGQSTDTDCMYREKGGLNLNRNLSITRIQMSHQQVILREDCERG